MATSRAPAAVPNQHEERYAAIVAALSANNFDRLVGFFDDGMKAAVSAQALEATWMQITAALGPLRSCDRERDDAPNGFSRRSYRVHFREGTARLLVVLAGDNRVAGLFINDVQRATSPCPAAVERDAQVGVAPPLPGTLVLPARASGRVPAVLLVGGSGPHDRDETIGPNKPMRDIACALAEHGVASLRFDKRSFAAASSLHDRITVEDEIIRDAVAAVAVLRAAPEIDISRIVVVGHSLGATVAPDVAAATKSIAALVLIAPPGRDYGVVIVDQMRHIGTSASELAAIETAFARIRAGSMADDEKVLGAPAAYWRDLTGRDAVRAVGGMSLPVLAIFGGCDYQVTLADERIWRQRSRNRAGLTIARVDGVNHLMTPSCKENGPSDYSLRAAVDPRVIDLIAQFINDVPRRQ